MGLVTSRVLAGQPGAPSDIGLPGLGLIEDRSQLETGESPQVEIIIDRELGTVQAPFGERTVALNLVGA